MPSFIADGYEFGSGVNPIAGVHDGLEFFHRPMTPIDSAQYIKEIDGLSGRELREVQADWLMSKIVRWQSPKGKDGSREKLPKLTKQIFLEGDAGMCIEPNLHAALIEVVIWNAPADYQLTETYEEAVGN